MKELSLFEEKTMTTKEVAKVLNVAERTIRRHAEKMGLTVNGLPTMLTESEVTQIKLKLERSGRNDLDNVVHLPKTNLEKQLLIKQAMILQQEMIQELQAENEVMKPKALAYDSFLSSENTLSMSEVAKSLGTGSKRLFDKLRKIGILQKDNTPYQQYMKYFEVIFKPCPHGESVPVTRVKPSGVNYIRKIIGV